MITVTGPDGAIELRTNLTGAPGSAPDPTAWSAPTALAGVVRAQGAGPYTLEWGVDRATLAAFAPDTTAPVRVAVFTGTSPTASPRVDVAPCGADCADAHPSDPLGLGDADGDGIPDDVDGYTDMDRDGLANDVDTDSDGDGVPDAEEGIADHDGDGRGDWVDPDSDGDGRPDAAEGSNDDDCDGIPNRIDPNDHDGDCDADVQPAVDTAFSADDNDPHDPGAAQFTGGGCATAPIGPGAAVVAFLALIRRRRRAVLAAILVSGTASAQDIDAQRFRPAVDGDRFVSIEDPFHLSGDPQAGAAIGVDHADEPLVQRRPDGTHVPLLGAVTTARALGHVWLGPVLVGVDVPVHLARSGFVAPSGLDKPDLAARPLGAAMGDPRATARVVAPLGERFASAAFGDVTIPIGGSGGYTHAARAHTTAGVAFGARPIGATWLVADVGARSGTGRALGALRIGPSVIARLGASHQVGDAFVGGLEFDGERWLGNSDQPGAMPIEGVLYARMMPAVDWTATVIAGRALSAGVSAPTDRVGLVIAFAPRPGRSI